MTGVKSRRSDHFPVRLAAGCRTLNARIVVRIQLDPLSVLASDNPEAVVLSNLVQPRLAGRRGCRCRGGEARRDEARSRQGSRMQPSRLEPCALSYAVRTGLNRVIGPSVPGGTRGMEHNGRVQRKRFTPTRPRTPRWLRKVVGSAARRAAPRRGHGRSAQSRDAQQGGRPAKNRVAKKPGFATLTSRCRQEPRPSGAQGCRHDWSGKISV